MGTSQVMVSKEAKKAEALDRMKKLGIYDGAIKDFRKEDLIMLYEPPYGVTYWVTDENGYPELAAAVREFEEKHGALVYAVVRSYTVFGMMDSLLYVSDETEEWDMDREDIKDGTSMTYTINHSDPNLSEFGSIGFRIGVAGGLVRTA